MGEIADSLIDGEFDYISGEYLGEGVGYPRTLHGNNKRHQSESEKDRAYLQCKNLIFTWGKAKNIFDAVAIIKNYAIHKGWIETNAGTIGRKLLNEPNGWKEFKAYVKELPQKNQ